MSDAELVRDTLAGRPQAYEELVRRWAGRVTALCHAKVGCAAAADDLAQDALLRAYRSLRTLDDAGKFGPWLCRIAQNGCLNWLKDKRRDQVPFSVLGPDHDPETYLCGPEPDAGRDEQLEDLKAAVAALPEVYREVVLLYYHQNLTYRDLADMLGVAPATVNARLTKARVLLRERMSQCRR